MHRYLADIAEARVPRYTSYPTALAFDDGVGAGAQADALAAVPSGTAASLYVHIPFCDTICWYCGCTTGAVGRRSRLTAYIDAVIVEATRVAEAFAGQIEAVHFGGGSPNALDPHDLARLAAALRDNFAMAPGCVWAIELDPRSFDTHYAERLAECGFHRASLGVQTFAPHVQAAINRIQPARKIAAVVAELRATGIANLNFDLMYGLPGQRLDDIAATLARALPLAPSRIAMFGYAHLPVAMPRQRMIDSSRLPNAEQRFWQSALAHDLIIEAGYRAIGFDHFAKPDDALALAAEQGRLRRNFQGFSADQARVTVGLGASAISQFPGLIVQNEKHNGRYRMRVRAGELAGSRGVVRRPEDQQRADAIERLLCDGRLDLARLPTCSENPDGWAERAIEVIDALAETGIVARRGKRVEITSIGRPYARVVAAAFDGSRSGTARLTCKTI
jgi:oxygen-independent coproporphyrinogen-3 oxidase